MADEINKTIILGIELDTKDLAKQAAEIRQRIEDIKNAPAQKGTIAFEEQTADLKKLNDEYRNTQKQIVNLNKYRDAEAGSIKKMRAELAVATQKYNEMRDAGGEASERTKMFADKVNDLSAKLKKAEGAIGDNRRNVGNYTGGIKDAMAQMNMMPGALGGAVNGIKSLGAAFKMLLMNPIVLLIAAIVGALKLLYDAFKKTDSGGTELEARFKQIGAIIDVVMQRLGAFAKGLIELFKGNYKEAIEKMGSAFDGMSEQIKNATDAAYEYVYALDALQDAEDSYTSQAAKNANQIAKLEALSVDRTKSSEERKKALQQAISIGEEELKKQKEFADRRYQIEINNQAKLLGIDKDLLKQFIEADDIKADELLKNNADLAKARDNLNNEGQKSLEDFYSKTVQLDTRYFEENKRNFSKLSGFNKEINDKRFADNKAALELELLLVDKNSADYLTKKRELLNAEKEAELNNEELTKNQRLLIEQKYLQLSLGLELKYLDEKTAANKKQLDDKLAYQFEEIEKQKVIDAIKLANGEITEEQALQNQIEYQLKQLALYEDGTLQKLQAELALANMKKKLNGEVAKDEKKWSDLTVSEKRQAYNAIADIAGNTFGNIASMYEEGSEEFKLFSSAQIVMSTIQAAMNAYTSALAIPIIGPFLAPISAGIATAFGIAQLAKVNATPTMKKAEFGAIIGGNYHSQGGTKFYGEDGTRFEAEKDELITVVNRRSTAMLGNLSRLNQMGGGINFMTGRKSFLADGGITARGISSAASEQTIQANTLRDVMQSMPSPVVIVQDISQAQGRVVRIKSKATL